RRCSADVKDQVPLAMRMHVERAVQLIDRRAAKPAVEDGERLAHASPPARCSCAWGTGSNIPHKNSSAEDGRPGDRTSRSASSQCGFAAEPQYFLHSGTVRLGNPILANTAGS